MAACSSCLHIHATLVKKKRVVGCLLRARSLLLCKLQGRLRRELRGMDAPHCSFDVLVLVFLNFLSRFELCCSLVCRLEAECSRILDGVQSQYIWPQHRHPNLRFFVFLCASLSEDEFFPDYVGCEYCILSSNQTTAILSRPFWACFGPKGAGFTESLRVLHRRVGLTTSHGANRVITSFGCAVVVDFFR